ncbi:MAG: AIR synthase related protein [Candidatus Thorarchaeota archaeon]
MTRLEEIVGLLHEFEGISRKYVLPSIIGRLRATSYNGNQEHGLGEDSAAIRTNSDEIVLLTTDAIVEELCLNHPRAAGFNAVLATVMDIYAAGGTPTSFAVAISYSNAAIGDQILEGLIDGSHTFRVPIVRGHTNPQSKSTYVVGSATGTVKKDDMLTAGGAHDKDLMILLFDGIGQRGASYKLGWDSVTGRPAGDVVQRLSVMNKLAQHHLVTAAKDVSVAGIVGTAGMLLEYSGKGGVLDLNAVDSSRPESIELEDWIRMFVSLGFLVTVNPDNASSVMRVADDYGLTATIVGEVDSTLSLRLSMSREEQVMFDYSEGPLLTPKGEI